MMQEKDAKGAAEEMKRILVTGFEPFGGETVNPSWEAVRALPEEIPGGRLVKAQIPVEYEKSGAELRRLLEKENPDLTILCGQAGGRKWVCVECCAINRDHAQAPDNAGEVRRYRPIAPEGPAAYFTDLPVEKMVAEAQAAGVPCEPSFSAGTYVCNHLYYTLLSKGRRGCFIHVPYSAEQARDTQRPYLEITQMTQGILAAIQAAI